MPNQKKLGDLVEKAASAATMMSPADRSEVDQLLSIFSQISITIEQAEDAIPEQVRQAQEQVSEITGLLQKMAELPTGDTEGLLDEMLKSMMQLQEMVQQAAQPETADAPAGQNAESNDSAAAPGLLNEEDVPLVLDFITESNEHIESAEAGLLELESKPDDIEVLNLIFRSFHTIKGMAGFLNLSDIGSLAHLTENLLDLARKGNLLLTGAYTDIVFESIDVMKKMMEALKAAIDTQTPVQAQPGLAPLLQKLQSCTDAAGTEQPPAGKKASGTSKTDEQPAMPAPAASAPAQTEPADNQNRPAESENRKESNLASADEEKIKVSTTRLDNLVNMAGELVIAQLMVAEEAACGNISEYELNRKVSHQGKIIRELQELSMSMRMVQISGVFRKMSRLVRDVSRKADKQINFTTAGEETELDRSIVDKIADPLIHMLRNAVDHGIEPPEQRRKAGKHPVGTIELRAFHQAGNIVIEIEDDGKGLNKERILQKAVENGVIEADQQVTDEQVYKLIFHPGLSTAEKITSVSGRGVGMDVVKKNIESLRGRVDIASTPGKGTIFTIRLPLTLAMIDGQIVTVGQNRYIIPINAIVGTLRPRSDQLSTVQNKLEMVMVRGELMPLVRLYKLFRMEPLTEDPTRALLVIVEDETAKCCLLVDDLLAQQRVVIKNLGDGLGKVDCVSGGAIMGDGRVSLILDIPGLINKARA